MNPELMICGDWHGDTKHAVKMIVQAFRLDIRKIIQVGDFGLWDHFEEGMKFLDTVNDAARRTGVKIYWLDGNHENFDRLDWYVKNNPRTKSGHVMIRSHILYSPRGHRWTWMNRSFMTVGGAVSVDKKFREQGVSFWKQEQLSVKELRGISEQADYLFTHDCPTNAPFKARFKEDFESQIHRQRMNAVGKIVQPERWFHGHMHEKYEYSFLHDQGYADVTGLQMNGDYYSWGVLDILSNDFDWGPDYLIGR